MPAFSFEKIPAPSNHTPPAVPRSVAKHQTIAKSRGLIFQMLDRIAIARLKREQVALPSANTRKSAD